jgi:hypothetical protein
MSVTKAHCDANVQAIMKEFKEIRNDIRNVDIKIAELPEKILEKTDSRYAPKWAADAVKWTIATMMIVVIGAIMALVIKQ